MKIKILILISAFVFLFVIEKIIPLRRRKDPVVGRALVNVGLSLLTYAVAWFTVNPLSHLGIFKAQELGFGILHWLRLTYPWDYVVGFVALDLLIYYWHWANHKISWMWRFHNVHHYDRDLDVTTSFRFHFVEVGYSAFFRFMQVLVTGVSVEVFAVYELVFQIATFFHHSNWRLPWNLERLLNLVFVTPRMHGIHHSQVHEEADSNYAVVFSLWDRLHRTFVADVSQAEIDIGVPGYAKIEEQRFLRVVFNPFRHQLPYWNFGQVRKPSNSNMLSMLRK